MWECTCCHLLNAANRYQCQACYTHCTVTDSAYICTECKQVYSDQIFRWSKCNHTYCVQCISKLINESLSKHNTMPRCIHSCCQQILLTENGDMFKDLLLKKYRITHNMTAFDRTEKLISGYIRTNGRVTHINMVQDLISLMHDYYDLVYCTKIKCYQCKTLGYELADCDYCSGLGYTDDCKICEKSGKCKYDVDCSKCNATGDYIFTAKCNNCNGSGQYSARCRRCNDTGYYITNGYSHGQCIKCKGTKKYGTHCRKCNGTGIFKRRHDCRGCNGKRVIPKQKACYNCRGTGCFKMSCNDCRSSGKIRWECYKCGGYTKLLVLHFNKLCNKQVLCHHCNEYFPKNMIIYFPKCYHSYCHECILSFIERDIKNNNIPSCLLKTCHNALTLNNLDFILRQSDKNIYSIRYLSSRECRALLKQILFRKGKFCCTECYQWHPNKTVFAWSECDHKYSKQCAKLRIDRVINHDGFISRLKMLPMQEIPICASAYCTQLLKLKIAAKLITKDQYETLQHLWNNYGNENTKSDEYQVFLCFQCLEYSPKSMILYWPSCGHMFCHECMLSYIGNEINNNRIPICAKSSCNTELTLSEFTRITNPLINNGSDYAKLKNLIYIKDKSRCGLCYRWYQTHSIVHWPQCNHTFCVACIVSYIPTVIGENRIPKCPKGFSAQIIPCEKELTLSGLQSIHPSLPYYIYDSWLDTDIENNLSLLIYRKDRFCCTKCGEWHQNGSLFMWSKCGHKYGQSCAKGVIDTQLPQDESVFNVFKKKEIPKCTSPQCIGILLYVKDAVTLGANKYQRQTLHNLYHKRGKGDENCIMM